MTAAAGGTMRMRYHFGSHTLDVDTVELRSNGETVVLEPRTFAVLAYLIRNRDRVVPKEELLDEIWGDRFVGEAALTSQIKHVRAAVGDDGRSQQVIRTAHRIGYRFVADVIEESSGGAAGQPAAVGRPPIGQPPVGQAPVGQRPVGPAATWRPSPGKAVFGRDDDLDELAGRLAGHRLVTITGPGGVGKTALAGRLLDEQAGLAPDGAWMCDLATTRDPATIANVVLGALGEGQQSDADPGESLLRFLERRRALVVLDNCEHVLGAAADLARGLLGSCPELRVVATSRVPLGVDGESVHALEPLALADAVSCFAARAGDAGAVVDRDDPSLADLCRRLDCVPLALELAAARARLLSPGEMLTLLADRFKLLRDPGHGEAGGADDGRHRSLHRTIAWSWDGLSAEDQRLLARLSVFVGAFTLEDARRVAMEGSDPLDAVDALGRLVGGSLMVVVPAPSGRTRFRLLESIRDFAADHLDDPEAVRARHAAYYAALAEELDAAFQTERIDEALAAMETAWDNLRAAVGYAARVGDVGTVRRVVRAVGAYADVFQVYELLDWCAHADAEAGPGGEGDDVAIAADALAVQARMLAHRGEQERARKLAVLAHDRHESHATLLSVVWCAYYGGDLDL
ncbi:MAG TPA: winged helix-turn-helix domain-containing protein, partial [Acidimicrobiales bacterium]